ncbi:MAG: hypothetical protein Q9196_000811 [Gyalolechia fulgens]
MADAVDMAEPGQHKSKNTPRQQKPVKTGTWLPAENTRLRQAVAKYGTRWVKVASEVGTRNGDQCAKRWNENLNPELDHSPWTPEEDERLLTMVKTYGHNWKFMAHSFLELRAPLALKNRHSLLMRRVNRQGDGQEQAKAIGTKPARQATAPSRTSDGNQSPSPHSALDLTSLFNGGMDPQPHHQDYSAMSAPGSNFPLPTGLFVPGMMGPSDTTATDGRRRAGGGKGNTTLHPTMATGWDHQDLLWQQHPILGTGLEPDNLSSGTITNAGESEMEDMTRMEDNDTGSRRLLQSGLGVGPRNVAPSEGETSGITPDGEVEYSATCQWGKLKTLMCHLVDAAMAESAEWTAADDQVTVTFLLKVL